MTVDLQRWKKKRRRLWLATAAVSALLAIVVVPPLVSISRYKSRITQLMSESLRRPVRLSSVELRLFPWPGFVLTDLTVEEDPAYGAEPVLHAETVKASIRLLPLWRGRLEIGTIGVDNASLNVVRTTEGRWNLDPLFRTAAAKAEPAEGSAGTPRSRRVAPLPYLEATNSRINFKRGAEKLPFSLVDTDLSFWQEQPGDWRIRLRGQPARTDLSLDLADTGLVRLEARVESSSQLRQIPLHVDLEWREAQLGQLTRLLIGSDPGWRGDLTGELHLDGTPDAAQIQTRLRATGVHRAEFAPAAPMDFDASCGFLYHLSARAVENLACDSPLGDGRIHLAGDLPGNGAEPHLSIEVDRIPVAAGLDALRTVRSDLGPGLEASGSISGKISYAPVAAQAAGPVAAPAKRQQVKKGRAVKTHVTPQGPLTGSFTVAGFELSGDGLKTPIRASKLVLEPAAQRPPAQETAAPNLQSAALMATVTIPAGGTSPLVVTARLGLAGYQLTLRGQASVARARELVHVAGMADAGELDSVAGEPVTVDLESQGPWLPKEAAPLSKTVPAAESAETAKLPMAAKLGVEAAESPTTDSLSGTVTLHNANWRADYLASPVEITQATLHMGQGDLRWDPIVFSYGPVKGTATLDVPQHCEAGGSCPPRLQVAFGKLDASTLQAAILGAHEKGTLLSSLIARFRPSNAPAWPRLEGTVKAESLLLGPVTLTDASADVRIVPAGTEITDLDADLLGGHVHGSGTIGTAADEAKPVYSLECQFEKLAPPAVGKLLGMKWTGGAFQADGKIDLSGFTAKDLAASAKGNLHFEWRRGLVETQGGGSAATGGVPEALKHFDSWTAEAEIANGAITLKDSGVQQGARKQALEGALSFGEPPKVSFAGPKETRAKR
jgi:AsmA family